MATEKRKHISDEKFNIVVCDLFVNMLLFTDVAHI